MLVEIGYDRAAAVRYAEEWAFARNPKYLNFDELGGDCTNYASQCLYAGCGIMNFTPVFGWYYIDGNRRTASWTGVEYLADFLLGNDGAGPYGRVVAPSELELGDIVQLGDESGRFYHSPVVCGIEAGEIFVAAHTYDRWMYPLSSYVYAELRPLHIVGCRRERR